MQEEDGACGTTTPTTTHAHTLPPDDLQCPILLLDVLKILSSCALCAFAVLMPVSLLCSCCLIYPSCHHDCCVVLYMIT